MKLDIQDSKDRLDVLEGTTITTINEQITAINSSITDLQDMDETLDGYIKTLETTTADLMKRLKIYCIQEEKTMTFLNWTGSKMGVRMTNVTHLPPLTRPGQSAPESHRQKNHL